MKIGIKYCGGCNPQYDRVAEVNKLIEQYPEISFEPASKDGIYDLLIIVSGCTRVCASHSELNGKQKIFVKNEKEFDNVKKTINELTKN